MRRKRVPLSWASWSALVLCVCVLPVQAQQNAPSDLPSLISNLNEVVTATRVSLAKLRIEKWKTASDAKKRLQSDAQAIDRNLSEAVPSLEDKLREQPQSLSSNFAIYRNLDAVHDVLNLLTQTAAAVAPDDEYSALANNAGRLDDVRRAFADRVESLAAASDAELARAQSTGVPAAKSEPTAPPKKIVIDDMAPAKKPSAKKKSK